MSRIDITLNSKLRADQALHRDLNGVPRSMRAHIVRHMLAIALELGPAAVDYTPSQFAHPLPRLRVDLDADWPSVTKVRDAMEGVAKSARPEWLRALLLRAHAAGALQHILATEVNPAIGFGARQQADPTSMTSSAPIPSATKPVPAIEVPTPAPAIQPAPDLDMRASSVRGFGKSEMELDDDPPPAPTTDRVKRSELLKLFQ